MRYLGKQRLRIAAQRLRSHEPVAKIGFEAAYGSEAPFSRAFKGNSVTATPIAMTHHHHELSTAATVIQLHVLGMFLPSFVTGSLILYR